MKQRFPVKVSCDGQVVGEYFADLLVNDLVIIELKAAEQIIKAYEAQLIDHLKATNLEVGLILNFSPKAEFNRRIFSNLRKPKPKGASCDQENIHIDGAYQHG